VGLSLIVPSLKSLVLESDLISQAGVPGFISRCIWTIWSGDCHAEIETPVATVEETWNTLGAIQIFWETDWTQNGLCVDVFSAVRNTK
jgi:hypothetical protein